MPVSYSLTTGGQLPTPGAPLNIAAGGTAPVMAALIEFYVSLPDTYGGNVTFNGRVSPVSSNALQPSVAMSAASGSATAGWTIALPAVPSSGTTFWALQVNLTTGVVTMKTSSTAAPTADAGNLVLMQMQIKPSDTIPWSYGVAASTSLGTAPTFLDLN